MTATPATKSRLASFDLLKFAAIFFVLWGHAIQHLLSTPGADNALFRFISAFHMPLFMAIAGFFSGSAKRNPPVKFLWRKGLELLLPTFVMGVATILLQKWLRHSATLDLGWYVLGFWFLKSLFLCFVLYVGANLCGRYRLWALAATLLLSQCVGFAGVCRMYPVFLLGVALKHYFPVIQANAGKMLLASGLLFLLLLPLWDAGQMRVTEGFHPLMEAVKSGSGSYFLHLLLRLGVGTSGTLLFICGAELLCRRFPSFPGLRLLTAVGAETKGIYIVQLVLLETVMPAFVCLDSLPLWLTNWVVTPVISFALLALIFVIVKLINRSRPLSLLLLGNQPPKKFNSVKL